MNVQDWEHLQEVFETGSVLDETGREELLRSRYEGDDELKARVREMWREEKHALNFLEQPAAHLPFRIFHTDQLIGDRFRLLEFLGSGGMGEVYRARDERLGRIVAVKVLTSQSGGGADMRLRLQHEARAISALCHPRICTLHDLCWEGDLPFLVMEYLEGETLATRLQRGSLSKQELLTFAVQIAEGLACAHQHGLIHRDLKPANIMLTQTGIKLLDFGIAKHVAAFGSGIGLNPGQPQTGEGAIIGTVAYMSPEQAEGKPLDTRSDVFTFGAVLYEMASGKRAFEGNTDVGTLTAVLKNDPPPLRRITRGVPPGLDKIVRQCLRKDPNERFASTTEINECLRALTKTVTAFAVGQWISATAGLLLLLLGGAVIYRTAFPPPPVRTGTAPTQLTYDSGVTREPALSPDGRFIAYVSDRGQGNASNLWLQNVKGGETVQLTRSCINAADVAFTPDGSHLIFYCLLEGADGVYKISVLGGEPQLLVRGARYPAVSPDGRWLAYSKDQQLTIVSPGGGTPFTIAPDFLINGRVVWTPDSDHLFLVGSNGPALFDRDEPRHDVWMASVTRRTLKQTNIMALLRKAGLSQGPLARQPSPTLLGWLPEQHLLFLSFYAGDAANVWSVQLSPDGEPAEGLQQITFGFSKKTVGTLAGGSLAFESYTAMNQISALPLGADGVPKGSLKEVTRSALSQSTPVLTPDGKSAVFVASRAGSHTLSRLDLDSGREQKITNLPASPSTVTLNHQGSEVAFSTLTPEPSAIYRTSVQGGQVERVLGIRGTPTDWLPDGSGLIVSFFEKPLVAAVHVSQFQPPKYWVALCRPSEALFMARISPDGRWLAFRRFIRMSATFPTARESRLYVAPFEHGALIPPEKWIPVVEGIGYHEWSKDGRFLYELRYNPDRSQSIVAHRLDEHTKRPVAKATIYENSLWNPSLLGFSASSSGLLLFGVQYTSNIWVINLGADVRTQ